MKNSSLIFRDKEVITVYESSLKDSIHITELFKIINNDLGIYTVSNFNAYSVNPHTGDHDPHIDIYATEEIIVKQDKVDALFSLLREHCSKVEIIF